MLPQLSHIQILNDNNFLCVSLLLSSTLTLQDMKLRQIVTMGSVDTLEQKTVTVCYGTDFVNVTFVNFCCTRRDIAQVSWPKPV